MRLLLLLAVAGSLNGCMGQYDWDEEAKSLGMKPSEAPGPVLNPNASENEEAQIGPKDYDAETRRENALNEGRH